ncbi:hypothetical protein ECC02_001694 [Trypanosoma cruzi]|uniref:Uncharacterized protein n=1 Tax=Trypanosoma cruzi TaxID=5693 RepID=A0A7J6YEP6_TRYCR|nr:hypothetical protein ECC02_001694 [Trypanosoma cruzi]
MCFLCVLFTRNVAFNSFLLFLFVYLFWRAVAAKGVGSGRGRKATMRRGFRAASMACAQPCQAVPLFSPFGENLHMWRFSALALHHQQQFRRLASLVAGGARDDKKTLVACSVVAHQRPVLASPTQVVDVTFCATGVNHALHRQFNAGKTLKGILRGCAEQNALGVAAASGQRYSAITDVYLYALPPQKPCPLHASNNLHSHPGHGTKPVDETNCVYPIESLKGTVFPCPECWRNLSTVAEMRHDDGEEGPLNLFVQAQNETSAMWSVSVARRCLMSSPTPAIVVTIVLPE